MRNYGDYGYTCNPHDDYMHVTGYTLWHRDSPHFLWGKHLQCLYIVYQKFAKLMTLKRFFHSLRGLSQITFAFFGIFWPRTPLVCTFYVVNYTFFWPPTHPKCKRNLWKAPYRSCCINSSSVLEHIGSWRTLQNSWTCRTSKKSTNTVTSLISTSSLYEQRL